MDSQIHKLISLFDGEIDITHALQSKWPGSQWIGNGSSIDDITWLESNIIPKPSQSEIDVEMAELQSEYDAQEYARNRKTEYDALNQFELMSDDSINSTTTHKDAILAIKAKYPKG